MLLGVVRPTRGEVRGARRRTRGRARSARASATCPSASTCPARWTPPAFLASVARLKGLRPAPRALIRRSWRAWASRTTRDRRIGGFSKGMRQRLGLAAALLGAPELLVLDEPTDGIDPLGRVEVRSMLAEERARGATLFLNSHLLAETERVCDRVGILAGGRLRARGRARGALRQRQPRCRVRFAPGLRRAALRRAGLHARPRARTPSRCEADDAGGAQRRAGPRPARRARCWSSWRRTTRDLEDVLAEAVAARRARREAAA